MLVSYRPLATRSIVWLACTEVLARFFGARIYRAKRQEDASAHYSGQRSRAPDLFQSAGGHRPGCRPLDRDRAGPRARATTRRRPALSKEASRALTFESSLPPRHVVTLPSERDQKTQRHRKAVAVAVAVAAHACHHTQSTQLGCLSRGAPEKLLHTTH